MNHWETAYGLLRVTMGVIFLFYGVVVGRRAPAGFTATK